MRTSKQIREDIQAKHDNVDAIVAVAVEEKRDLTAEEQTLIDAIQGAGDSTGEIGKLSAELARIEKIEARQREIAAQRHRSNLADVGHSAGGEEDKTRIVIPATAKRFGNLKAFKGPDADKNAYTAGKFMQAVLSPHEEVRNNARQWCNDHSVDIRAAAQVEGDDTLGGIFVPPEMEAGMIVLLEQYGVFRRECGTIPMSSDKKTVPKLLSEVSVYFVGENQTITDSNMTFGDVTILAQKLAGASSMSVELNEDAIISMADQLTQSFARKLAEKEDNCGFNGDGSSTYGGMVGLRNKVTGTSGLVDAVSGNVSFATLDLEDFRKTQKVLSDIPGLNPKWYIHKKGWSDSIDRLALALVGNATQEIINGTPKNVFLGSEVVFANAMPSADAVSTIQVLYGDISMSARMGVRRGITISTDSSLGFLSDKLWVKVTERFGITCHETGGTIAGLKTAAS